MIEMTEQSENQQKLIENKNKSLNENENKIEQMEVFNINKDNYSTKDKIIYIIKGICSITSSIIHTFGYFSIWILGYSTIYLVSFRRYYNPKITFSHNYSFIPIINLAFSLISPISGIIEDNFGGKKTIFFSNFILCLSFSFLYYSRDIDVDYYLFFLNGFGIAIGFNIAKKNACSYFMNRKALICGIINLIPNILSFGLMFYNETDILNYQVVAPLIEGTYYTEKIFINYQKLIISQIKILSFTCLGSILLYFQNDPKETAKFGFNEKNESDNKDDIYIGSNNRVKRKKKLSKKKKIMKAILSKRTLNLIVIGFLFFPTVNLIANTMRMDLYLHFLLGLLHNIVGCISLLIFTIIGDCFQFKILFFILSVLLSIASFIFIKFYDNNVFYLCVSLIFVSFISNAFNVIFDSHIMKIYGMDNFIIIWGVIRGSSGISEIFGVYCNFNLEDNSYIYKIIYSVTGIFNLISSFLCLLESEDKFNYDD
jgi:MFS family permease